MKKFIAIIPALLLLMIPVQTFAGVELDNIELNQNMAELDETINLLDDIENDSDQTNSDILNILKERIKLTIRENSQIVGNTSETKYQVNLLKDNKTKIRTEVERIRTTDANFTDEQLASLIKQSQSVIMEIKDQHYQIGKVGHESIKLLKNIKQKNLVDAKKQVEAIINAQNQRISKLQALNNEIETLLETLQSVR